MASKTFARDYDRARQQQADQNYGAGLDAANAEGTKEHMARGANYRGDKVNKNEKPRTDRRKGSAASHRAEKRAGLGEALAQVAVHTSPSTAIRMLAPKDGNRAARNAVKPKHLSRKARKDLSKRTPSVR